MVKYYPDLGLTREELLTKVQSQMSKKRFKHVLGVEEESIRLAKLYGANTYKAGLAGLLHDYAKELPLSEYKRLVKKYELDKGLLNWGSNVLHGTVGVYKIQEDLGLTDTDVLNAIKYHTIGRSDMSLLEKIVYVADYIEPGRDFPGVKEARKIAKKDLNKAVAYETVGTVGHLVDKEYPIYPKTLDTYNAYIKYL